VEIVEPPACTSYRSSLAVCRIDRVAEIPLRVPNSACL
jgi:hypothetical protein